MTTTSSKHFGLIIAYLLPGFIGLLGIAPFAPPVAAWLQPEGYAQASLGPPAYALLAATTAGMVISCVRWLVIDRIHAWTGLTAPAWDDAKLADRVAAFDYLVESHYRYYQFVANALVAVLLTYSVHRWRATLPLLGLGSDAAVLLLCVVLFAASRDALAKYYKRTNHLVGQDLNAPILGEPCTTETTMHTRPGPTRRPPLQSRHQTTSALHNPGRVRGSRRRQGSRKIAAED